MRSPICFYVSIHANYAKLFICVFLFEFHFFSLGPSEHRSICRNELTTSLDVCHSNWSRHDFRVPFFLEAYFHFIRYFLFGQQSNRETAAPQTNGSHRMRIQFWVSPVKIRRQISRVIFLRTQNILFLFVFVFRLKSKGLTPQRMGK